jgi:predicted ATP-grasp superfamily ATP-dependent carboligase
MYTGGLENYPALVDEWAKIRPLWGNSASVLRGVRNPLQVADALRRAGLCCPAVTLDARSAGHEMTWLRKSLRSSGGAHISPWNPNASGGTLPRGYYLQEFVEGLACSALYVAARGEAVLLGITRQLVGASWTGAQGRQYCGSVGPLAESPEIEANFARIGAALAREFKLLGLFGVDAILSAQRIWPVEVNPRYTASVEVLERAYGFHAVELHVAACCSGLLPTAPDWASRGQYGKAVLFASRRWVIPSDFCSIGEPLGAALWPAFADIPAPGSVIEAGWPILTVMAAGSTERDVLEALRRQAEAIESALA